MATPRLHVTRNALPAISSTYWSLLNDAPLPTPHNKWEFFTGVAALWPQFKDDILTNWASTRPGTRPSCWWRADASETRQRLGGKGTATHDALAYAPEFEKGLPTSWLTASDVVFYFPEGLDDGVEAFDPSDPPRFESQASYLARHKLLLPGERKRLKKRDFEPEVVAKPTILESSDDE